MDNKSTCIITKSLIIFFEMEEYIKLDYFRFQ